ncbi:MAG TPA: organic hydroperoxide resistance protein [Candidatus Baltobacteraceae bacterium]|jgi:Ohr subfamily peroxiredoxin|nr:organic hydroperoxide resistance protein [Candidatus Baltobacteraceae bacterium]
MNALYTASVTAIGGRDGGVRSSDGVLDLKLAIPKGLGGPGGEHSNPEQLFASAYSACFLGALKYVASAEKTPLQNPRVTVDVTIGKEGEGFRLEAEIRVAVPGLEKAKAETLIRAAHAFCPYSKAIRNNIPVRLSLVDASEKVHALA